MPICRRSMTRSVSRSRRSTTRSPSLQKELQAQSATLSDADRASKAKHLDEKQKALKRTGEDAQGDFQQDMQQTFACGG